MRKFILITLAINIIASLIAAFMDRFDIAAFNMAVAIFIKQNLNNPKL